MAALDPRYGVLCARPGDYLWFEWADEGVCAVFDRGTGETHLISILPAAALRALCDRPIGFGGLTERLIAEGVIGSGEDWLGLLAQSVDGLIGLELIASG